MPADFPYDVFLSHNSADKPRARRLAERLRAANRRVGFDEWVIQPGDDIYLAIERGLEAARALACPAEASQRRRKGSTDGRGNWPVRDPANAGRRSIPLLLADVHRHKKPVAICDLESA